MKTPIYFAAAAAAATLAGPAWSQTATLPDAVAKAVQAAQPGMVITAAELKERDGRRYYDVGGRTAGGDEVELDMLETPAGWTVVETQRDLPWSATPQAVRDAAPDAKPVRVIESRQNDGMIIYELFAAGQPKEPAMEVQFKDGVAKRLTERWPH